MPKIEKAERRDKARDRASKGMRRSGDSVKTLQEILRKRAQKAKEERRELETRFSFPV